MTTAFWRELGSGATPVVALHCSLAHSGSWRRLSDHLADRLSMQAMDLPGHGRSPAFDPTIDVAAQSVAWASEGLKEPVHLFGHSFGGYVALRLAVEYPEKVLSLSLYEPVFFAAAQALNAALYDAYRAEMVVISELLATGDAAEGARRFVRSWGDGRRWFDLPEEMRAGLAAGMPTVLAAQSALIEDAAGVLGRIHQINVPTLLMDGALSHATMPIVQDALAARIPNARRMTLSGAGHMGVITHPDAVAAEFAKQL